MRTTHRAAQPRPDVRPEGEAGTGLIGTTAGVVVFLVLLLFAVQVAYGLSATSASTSKAWGGESPG